MTIPAVTRAAASAVAEKIYHGFWTGIGITTAVSVISWGKFMIKDACKQVDWGKTLERARDRPSELFENPKRAK